MDEISKNLLPAEVKIRDGEKPKAKTEFAVGPLTVNDRNGNPKKLYFKSLLMVAENDKTVLTRRPFGSRMAEFAADYLKDTYESAQLCFGEDHVTRSEFVIGHSISGRESGKKTPEVHLYQEKMDGGDLNSVLIMPIEETLMKRVIAQAPRRSDDRDKEYIRRLKETRAKIITEIRDKKPSELNEDDPIESHIKRQLERIRVALKDFYTAYVQSVLLGYIPDLGYLYTDSIDQISAGMIFGGNVGIATDSKTGKIQLKLLDWGVPRLDVLTNESRKRLKELTESKKKEGRLPVDIIKKETFISVKEDSTEELDLTKRTYSLGNPEYQLADWYRNALLRELKISLATKTCPDFIKSPERMVQLIENIVSRKDVRMTETPSAFYETFNDLETVRRLAEAEIYGTSVIRVIKTGEMEPSITYIDDTYEMPRQDNKGET